MWFDVRTGAPDWTEAERHLRANDPVLALLMDRVGPCTLAPLPDLYETLMLAIFSQQLSVKGAETLFRRFKARFTRATPTPRKVIAALGPNGWDEETIRNCGISRQKRAYLNDLSRHILDKRLPLEKLGEMPDEEVISRLTDVKGIGEWTAQMYLMFVLCRPDVLPTADLGLQEAARIYYNFSERPKHAPLTILAEPWRPWRTIATWYLWRAKEG